MSQHFLCECEVTTNKRIRYFEKATRKYNKLIRKTYWNLSSNFYLRDKNEKAQEFILGRASTQGTHSAKKKTH